MSTALPPAKFGTTTYSAVAAQARFHLATNIIYTKVISVNFPSAAQLLQLDDELIEPWRSRWAAETLNSPLKFRLSQKIMEWRYRNFRIVMYRPFVIKRALQARGIPTSAPMDSSTQTAFERCLHQAQETIYSIHEYWTNAEQNRLAAWYGLYFLFQASLIPCVCLRNQPGAHQAAEWRTQIHHVLAVTEAMFMINPASKECHQVILKLCAGFLDLQHGASSSTEQAALNPVEESPQTQLSGVYSMMWPGGNLDATDIDAMMPDDSWTAFLTDASPMFPDDVQPERSWI